MQEGLRVFHNSLNKIWTKVLKEGLSGKGKEEVWLRFLYLLHCDKTSTKPDEKDFDFDKMKHERPKWVYAFKNMGPPCEFLQLGTKSCHEYLNIQKDLEAVQTPKKRKAEGLSPRAYRETKACRNREAEGSMKNAVAFKNTHNCITLLQKQKQARFKQLRELHDLVYDSFTKKWLKEELLQLALSNLLIQKFYDNFYLE